MFIRVLEGLYQPESLIYRSSHWQIVHGDLPQDAFVIDDEEPPERHSEKKVYHFKHTIYMTCLMSSNSSFSSLLCNLLSIDPS